MVVLNCAWDHPLGGIGGIWERPEVTPEVAVEGNFVGFGSAVDWEGCIPL